MARHGSERSLHSPQSMHLPLDAPSESVTCTVIDGKIKVNAENSVVHTTGSAAGTVSSPTVSSASSSLDSRIPRPSPTSLRRSASLRMRGERVSPNHPPPPPSTAANAALSRHHQQHRRSTPLHYQQYHHLDYYTFPVITENGAESPRQRSLVSTLSLSCFRCQQCHFSLFVLLRFVMFTRWTYSCTPPQYYAVFAVR